MGNEDGVDASHTGQGSGLDGTAETEGGKSGLWCPFDLTTEPIGRFLNCEIADHPVYDGLELQYFDDEVHGTGMLALLSRRADRRIDYYHEPGLALDPATFAIGGGTGRWTETRFEAASLEVAVDGVAAEVRFADTEGRVVEVRVGDRDGRRRRRGDILAPVGAGIDSPDALLLVYLHGFDLVRAGSSEAMIRIDGQEVATGQLPGRRLHRRLLIKYAAPLCAVRLNPTRDGPITMVDRHAPGGVELASGGRAIAALTAGREAHHTRLSLEPAMPDLAALGDGAVREGSWTIEVDGMTLTGGAWSVTRRADEIDLSLDVNDRWRPGPLPALLRVVTAVVPTFRRWPTTYRWTGKVGLGEPPTMDSGWQRTTGDRGDAYRRVTGS